MIYVHSVGVEYKKISHTITNEGKVGGVDACLGDSGGPIWRVVKHPTIHDKYQSVVVGIVKSGWGNDWKGYIHENETIINKDFFLIF